MKHNGTTIGQGQPSTSHVPVNLAIMGAESREGVIRTCSILEVRALPTTKMWIRKIKITSLWLMSCNRTLSNEGYYYTFKNPKVHWCSCNILKSIYKPFFWYFTYLFHFILQLGCKVLLWLFSNWRFGRILWRLYNFFYLLSCIKLV